MTKRRREKKINIHGAFIFFASIAAVAFVSEQWFVNWFNTSQAQTTQTSTRVVQEIAYEAGCLEQSLCREYSKAASDDREIIIPVLMYHHIRYIGPQHNARERFYSVNPKALEAQMKSLKEGGYTPITLETFWRSLKQGPGILPDQPVLLTFDDGHKSHMSEAYPILKKYNFPATFFIYTDGIKLNGYMDEKMLRELSSDPNMAIAAHSVTHGALTRMSAASREKEMKESKEILEDILEKPVTAFSYPYGAFSKMMEYEVDEAGYDMAFRIGPGSTQSYKSRFRIQRIQVLSWDDPVSLIAKYSGR